MKIIEIKKNENGSHDNITADYLETVPEGWAVIPEELETPNFPFGNVETEEKDGVMTVTKWEAGEIPEVEPLPKVITQEERIEALENALLEFALGGAE